MSLRIEKINKSFGSKQVLKNVSFSVNRGEALGYLGRNGAGKTTTIRIMADIFRADSGELLLDEKPIDHKKIRLGYLPEERGLYPKTKVGEQMIYIGELRGMKRQEAKKRALDLLETLEASEYWDKKLETLSKGNAQKIQLAIAVLHDPDIVILDEPFSGLDPVNASMLKKLIIREVERGKYVLFSSHQMPYVEEFCEHIAIINNGEIVLDGNIREIKRSYPRHRILINAEEDSEILLTSLKSLEADNIASSVEITGKDIQVILNDPKDKNLIFQSLLQKNFNIDKFEVVEPTLEEIFVEKAGEDT